MIALVQGTYTCIKYTRIKADAQLLKIALWNSIYTGLYTGGIRGLKDYSQPADKSTAVLIWSSVGTTSSTEHPFQRERHNPVHEKKAKHICSTIMWASAWLLYYSSLYFHKGKRWLTTRNCQETKPIPLFLTKKKKAEIHKIGRNFNEIHVAFNMNSPFCLSAKLLTMSLPPSHVTDIYLSWNIIIKYYHKILIIKYFCWQQKFQTALLTN